MKSLFDQLGTALQSGDLSAAKKAFSALQQNAPQEASAQKTNPMQNGFSALAQVLQSGDLSTAQQAISQIQQAGGHHHQGQAETTGTRMDTVDITGNAGTINIVEGRQGGTSTAGTTGMGAETINITGNTGTINITV